MVADVRLFYYPRSPSLSTIYLISATIIGEGCDIEYEYTIPFDPAIYRGISGCVLNSIANSQSLENLY